MYIRRHLESTIKRLTNEYKVLFICGARGVGKSTMLKKLCDGSRTYVSLDDVAARYLAVTDPALFLRRYAPPVLIDGIQSAPQLLEHIKNSITVSDTKGSVWLVSDKLNPIRDEVKSIFADDVAIIEMQGLSLGEINRADHHKPFLPVESVFEDILSGNADSFKQNLYEIIWQGSMPEIQADAKPEWEEYYSSYVHSFLHYDVLKQIQVRDEMVFYRFLCAAAAQTGKMINYGELAKASGISQSTSKQWVNLLEEAGIIYLLKPLDLPGAKYVVKAPKLHFADTGLAAYLLRWSSAEALEMGAMSAAFFESWVVGSIYKSYINVGEVPPLYYFRNFNSKEVELLIYKDHTIHPLAIKSVGVSNRVLKMMDILEPLEQDVEDLKIGTGGVICLANELVQVAEDRWQIPAWML